MVYTSSYGLGLLGLAILTVLPTSCSKGTVREPKVVLPNVEYRSAMTDTIAPPGTIEDLVAGRDAVVVATLSTPGYEHIVTHSIAVGATPPDPSEGLAYMDEPVTDYSALASVVLKGTIQIGLPFIVRLNGHLNVIPSDLATLNVGVPISGRRYLIVLSDNGSEAPSPSYSPHYGAQDLIFVDRETVSYSDDTPVPYATGMTGDQFVQAVNAALQ